MTDESGSPDAPDDTPDASADGAVGEAVPRGRHLRDDPAPAHSSGPVEPEGPGRQDFEPEELSSRDVALEDQTRVVRRGVPVDETRVVRRDVPVDETRVVRRGVPVDETRVVRRDVPVDETRVVRRSTPVDETAIAPPQRRREFGPDVAAGHEPDDATRLVTRGADDDATAVAPRSAATAPPVGPELPDAEAASRPVRAVAAPITERTARVPDPAPGAYRPRTTEPTRVPRTDAPPPPARRRTRPVTGPAAARRSAVTLAVLGAIAIVALAVVAVLVTVALTSA